MLNEMSRSRISNINNTIILISQNLSKNQVTQPAYKQCTVGKPLMGLDHATYSYNSAVQIKQQNTFCIVFKNFLLMHFK